MIINSSHLINNKVSYAWPAPTESGLQDQMCDDLQSAGINAFMDITKGDSSTNFDTSLGGSN
jgi:hypothetical protein